MNWLKTIQERIGIHPETVADLIETLKKCPQNWPIRNADDGHFCEINIATDGIDKEVSLY